MFARGTKLGLVGVAVALAGCGGGSSEVGPSFAQVNAAVNQVDKWGCTEVQDNVQRHLEPKGAIEDYSLICPGPTSPNPDPNAPARIAGYERFASPNQVIVNSFESSGGDELVSVKGATVVTISTKVDTVRFFRTLQTICGCGPFKTQ